MDHHGASFVTDLLLTMIISSNSDSTRKKAFLVNDWIVSGASVKGSAHVHSGRPNEDSIRWLEAPSNLVKILSIADGHGGANHFRSKIGSYIATKVSVNVLNNLFRKIDLKYMNVTQFRDIIRYSVPRHIVRKWDEMVTNHLRKNPISAAEIKKEFGERTQKILNIISTNPRVIYGSTLLSTVVTSDFILCFQIGDGEIIIVDKDRKTVRPFAEPERLTDKPIVFPLDETHSLSMNHSWDHCDVKMYSIDELQPRLVLASTDGYSNSFSNFDGFLKIGNDYLDILDDKGSVYLKKRLYQILKNTSDNGSGDDITLGYIYRKST